MTDIQRAYGDICLQDIRAAQVHAQMLQAAAVFSQDEYAVVYSELERLSKSAATTQDLQLQEDGYSWLDMQLDATIAELACTLETGRSLEDRHALVLRLSCKEMIFALYDRGRELMAAFVDKAQGNLGLLLPLKYEEAPEDPLLVSHYLLSYVWMLQRDLKRLRLVYEEADYNPLGSGAYAGVCAPIDRQMTTELLALSMPTANSVDGVSDRDFLFAFAQGCQLINLHMLHFISDYAEWIQRDVTEDTSGTLARLGALKREASEFEGLLQTYFMYARIEGLLSSPRYREDKELLVAAYLSSMHLMELGLQLVSQLYISQEALEEYRPTGDVQDFISFGGTAHKQVAEQLILAQNQLHMEEFYRKGLS